MSWTQVCCQYDGTFAGFLTCVFECYVHKEEPCEFRTGGDACCSLYPLRAIITDQRHAKRVYRSLAVKMGRGGQEAVAGCFLSCLAQREVWMWRFVHMGYQKGPGVLRDLADPTVSTVLKAVRFLGHEAHQFTGFVRFSELEGVLVSEIEPKNQVLPLLRPHFCGRYPQERFVIYDRTHKQALVHQPGRWAILNVDQFEPGPADEMELAYRRLWRSFYQTIAIQGRYNPRCRQTNMPKRYWGTMTEFQTDREDSVRREPKVLEQLAGHG